MKGSGICVCRWEVPNPDACPLFDSESDSDSGGTADEGSHSDPSQVDIVWATANRAFGRWLRFLTRSFTL